MVVIGYGGEMGDDLCNEFFDDMDFQYNRVKCRKIEQILPELNSLVDRMALDLGYKVCWLRYINELSCGERAVDFGLEEF